MRCRLSQRIRKRIRRSSQHAPVTSAKNTRKIKKGSSRILPARPLRQSPRRPNHRREDHRSRKDENKRASDAGFQSAVIKLRGTSFDIAVFVKKVAPSFTHAHGYLDRRIDCPRQFAGSGLRRLLRASDRPHAYRHGERLRPWLNCPTRRCDSGFQSAVANKLIGRKKTYGSDLRCGLC